MHSISSMTAMAIAARREAGLLLDDLRALHNLDPKGLDDLLPVPDSDFRIAKYPVTKSPGLCRVFRALFQPF
jgi:hypothetical protein